MRANITLQLASKISFSSCATVSPGLLRRPCSSQRLCSSSLRTVVKQSRPANQKCHCEHREAIQTRASLAPCPTNLTLIFCLQAKNLIMSLLIISFACKYHFATCQQNIIFKLCYRKPWIASSPLLLAKTVGIRGIATASPGLLRRPCSSQRLCSSSLRTKCGNPDPRKPCSLYPA